MAIPATLDDVVDAIESLESKTDDVIAKLEEIRILLLVQNVQIPLATILVQEFFNREDLDAGGGQGDSALDFPPPNNSIYGTADGFQLDETELEFPIVLDAVHSHEAFEFPVIIMTFQQYKDTLI